MSGKEKAENFDDDFELDALDEASWSDDESASGDGASESSEVSGESQASIKKEQREKKSGGGMLTGIVVLALLGGGSFYAYQSGMIPGVGPGQQGAIGESVIPGPADSAALETLPQETVVDTDAASSDSAQQMPPMPEAASEPVGEIVMTDTGVAGDSATVAAPLEATDEEALTPMPEGEGAVELTPLDSAEGDLEIAQVAEKDGMLSANPDQVVPSSSDVAAVDGKLQDGVMAVPGASDLAEGEVKELVGDDAPTSDSVALDEAALLGETEKTPGAEVVPAADSGVTAEQGALNELSDELEGSQIKEQAASSLESDLKAVDAASEADLKKDPAAEELTGAVSGDSEKGGLPGTAVADAPSVAADTSTAPAVPEPSSVQKSTDAAAESPATSPDEAVLPQAAPAPTQAKTVSPAASASPETPAEAEKVSEMPETEVAEAPAVAAEKPKEAVAQPVEPAKPAKPVVMPNWVLKSAKPGIAVLYDKRTGDVKTVGVGDRVAGLGRIKSVSKVDGRWVVEGTGGKVRQ